MKKFQTGKLSLVLFLFTVCQVLQAQPWSPLKLHEKFNFSINGVNFITNTVWTDSARAQGADSVFYLNRIVTNCDTCPVMFKLSNQPGILRSFMVRKPGGVYNFRNPGSAVIKTLAKAGDTWLYDSLANIQAQVVAIDAEAVFGINDSVKEILLSNGQSIRLSKNFGLLQFPSSGQAGYTSLLEGIEGRNLGQQVPKFREIYNFNTGDIFQYAGKNMSYAVPYGGGTGYLEKIQIPHLPSIYGAMLAGVSVVIMGAGIPVNVPRVLDLFAKHEAASYPVRVIDATPDMDCQRTFDPASIFTEGFPPELPRPDFLPIISSVGVALPCAQDFCSLRYE